MPITRSNSRQAARAFDLSQGCGTGHDALSSQSSLYSGLDTRDLGPATVTPFGASFLDAGNQARGPAAQSKKGRPCGQPFHCRAVVRLTDRDAWCHAALTPVKARIQLTDAGDRGD